jgi:protein SCO1
VSTAVGGTFSLVDHHGVAVTERTYRGRWVLVFFGFTHCAVVCPRALGRLDEVLDALGPLADAVQPLYVTVDPARDGPEVMRSYLEAAHPRFTGLTGSDAQIDAAKKAFRVYARRAPDPADPEGYAMPHTAFTHLLDPAGGHAAHWSDAHDTAAMTAELRALLAGPVTGPAGAG